MSPQPPTPQLRASDADREATVTRLRQGALEGRLDGDELEERIGAAYAARWTGELQRLTADITPAPPPAPALPPAPYVHPPAPRRETNGLAIAALTAGIVWIWWFGSVCALVFGHIALNQIKRSNGQQGGKGLAVGGLVLGYVGIATLLVTLVTVALR